MIALLACPARLCEIGNGWIEAAQADNMQRSSIISDIIMLHKNFVDRNRSGRRVVLGWAASQFGRVRTCAGTAVSSGVEALLHVSTCRSSGMRRSATSLDPPSYRRVSTSTPRSVSHAYHWAAVKLKATEHREGFNDGPRAEPYHNFCRAGYFGHVLRAGGGYCRP